MTVEYRNPTEQVANPGMDPRTRTMIAVVALVACLAIGGGIVYWLLFGSPPKRRMVQVDPQQQAAAMRTPVYTPRVRRDAPGITKTDEEWVIRSTAGEMRLRDKAGSATDPSYRFPDALKLPPEQVSLLAGRFRILHDDAMAAEWKVTPQQVEKLRALQIGPAAMTPSPQQRNELWNLWTQYNKASGGQAKIDAQKKLIEKLDEISKLLLEPERQRYTAKLEEIKKVLTPEQVQIITKR